MSSTSCRHELHAEGSRAASRRKERELSVRRGAWLRRLHSADAQRRQYLVLVVGVLFGEGPEEAEAAGDHHVAVGDGEVGVESAAAQFAALGPGDGQEGAARSAFDRLRPLAKPRGSGMAAGG